MTDKHVRNYCFKFEIKTERYVIIIHFTFIFAPSHLKFETIEIRKNSFNTGLNGNLITTYLISTVDEKELDLDARYKTLYVDAQKGFHLV